MTPTPESPSARLAALADEWREADKRNLDADRMVHYPDVVVFERSFAIANLASDVAALEGRVEAAERNLQETNAYQEGFIDAEAQLRPELDAAQAELREARAERAALSERAEKAEAIIRESGRVREFLRLRAVLDRISERCAVVEEGEAGQSWDSYEWEVLNTERAAIAAIVREALLGEEGR